MDDMEFKPPQSKSLYVLWFFVLIIAIIICGYIYLNHYTIQTEYETTKTHTTWFNQTITEKVYENVTIEEFFVNRIKYDKQQVSMLGYLIHTIERPVATPEHYYYITDNAGNRIELINLTQEQKELFPKQKLSEIPYTITGVYIKAYMTAQISVKDMQPYEDLPYKIVEKIIQIPQEVTLREMRVTNVTLWDYYTKK